jgi:hypothetical protein
VRAPFVFAAALSLLAALTTAGDAAAHPRPLPFTYTYPTLGKGEVEVEQYVDVDPVKALSAATGKPTFYAGTQLQTELEIGLTDRLELGLYATFAPPPTEEMSSTPVLPTGNGAKERLRLRLAEEGAWPVDVGLYGELTENEREIEVEGKVILARRFGRLLVATNLVAELEAYYKGEAELVLAPTAGVSLEAARWLHGGIEYFARGELPFHPPRERGFNLGPHHYLGPTMMFEMDRVFWSTGAYFRLSDVGRVLEPGDAFGPIYVRTIVGVGL